LAIVDSVRESRKRLADFADRLAQIAAHPAPTGAD
jgi:hypothetical protein